MRGGCTAAVMGSSVHPNNRFGTGFLDDSYYPHHHHHHQDNNIQHLQHLDQQMLGHMMFYPLPSPAAPSSTTRGIHQTIPGKDVGNSFPKRELSSSSVVALAAAARPSHPHQHQVLESRGDAELSQGVSSQALDSTSGDAYNETGELGCVVSGATRHCSWVHEEEDHHREFHHRSACENGLANASPLPIHHILSPSSSSLASPVMPLSPDCKTPEPRSVLDLAMSPRPTVRSGGAISSYEFVASSLGGGGGGGGVPSGGNVLLDAADDDFFSDFQRRDSASCAAALLGLEEEDESQWEPPTNSTSDWLQRTSQLWMDSLIEDLAETPVQSSSLPRLAAEDDRGDDRRNDTPPSTPCPSELCHKSPSIDQEHSEEQGDEEEENPTTSVKEGPTTTTVATTPEEDLLAVRPVQSGTTTSKETTRKDVGHELVNLLLACAEAVSTKSLSLVNPLFAQLGELASPEGTSMERMAAYFTEGLATRCSRLWPHVYQPLPCTLDLSEEDNLSAFHILNHVCPYIKFAHFTANDIILQAFEGCDLVHVIDIDIKQGLQWPALFQSLAARPGGPPAHVRVTGVGEYKEDVQDTGDRLAEFAEALDLPFEFHAVIDKLEDVRLWMLHVKEKEAVAVNCVLQLHRTLHDSENGIKDFLGLITSTKPKVVAIVEQEASHNGQFFEGKSPRFLEALQFYAAIFDSLDLNMPLESRARMKVEQFFAREIRNILACEGPERVERHEGIETWRLHMDGGGFKSVPLSKRATTQAHLLLEMFACKSYTITEDDEGALTLGWRSRSLFTASAWAPVKL